MTDSDYHDYCDFAPQGYLNSKDIVQEFVADNDINYHARRIISTIEAMPEPTNFNKGTATAINEQLQVLLKVMDSLKPETRQFLIEQEVEFILNEWGKSALKGDIDIPDHIRDDIGYSVEINVDGSLTRLRRFAKTPYPRRKVDPRHYEITRSAADIWKKFGGKVSQTEGDRSFVGFLEALIIDTKLAVSVRTLIENYL